MHLRNPTSTAGSCRALTRRALPNVIATFSFAWVGMLADWSLEQPDTALIVRHLPRMRRVLAWFEPLLNAQGLLGKNPQWNFIDWSGQQWDDRDTFPSWGKPERQLPDDGDVAGRAAAGCGAGSARTATRRAPRSSARRPTARAPRSASTAGMAGRGLFADDGDRKVFSQHMNVFAVLYDIATPDEAPAILETHHRAGPRHRRAGRHVRAHLLLRVVPGARLRACGNAPSATSSCSRPGATCWRSTTPPGPNRETSRARTPTPGARTPRPTCWASWRGFGRPRRAIRACASSRVLGPLTSLDATAATPHGPVKVSYRIAGNQLIAVIDRPASLPGTFIWRGKSHPLTETHTKFELPL